MTNDEILQAAKEERDRIVTEVMLSHTEEVDGFSYRWFAGRIADEVAAIIEKRTIERCAVVCEMLETFDTGTVYPETCAAAIRAME